MKIVVSDPIYLPEESGKDLRFSETSLFLRICPLPLMNLDQGLWVWKGRNMQVRVLPETDRSEQYGRKSSNMGTYRI